MKRAAISILMVTAIIGLQCSREAKQLPTKIDFITDFGKAKAMAARTGHPMIIDFYTDWGKYCHQLDTVTYVDSLVISMTANDIFVKINAEVDTGLARTYAISGYPTIVIARPSGEEIDRIWGFVEPTDFYNQVQLYLEGKETLGDYLSRLQAEPQNLDYLSTVGEKYASRSQFQKATEYYRKVLNLDPENEQNYAAKSLAAIYDIQGRAKDYKVAIETCTEIIKRYPHTPEADDATAMLGYFTAQNGDDEGALVLYRDYLGKYPDGRNLNWVQKRLSELEEKVSS